MGLTHEAVAVGFFCVVDDKPRVPDNLIGLVGYSTVYPNPAVQVDERCGF